MTKVCPSSSCEPGALLLGVVQPDGTVAFANQPFAVSETFVETALKGRAPEERFRFAGACVSKACEQWQNGRCSIPDQMRSALGPEVESREPLAHCAIRQECRWFAQESYGACKLCPLVTTHRVR